MSLTLHTTLGDIKVELFCEECRAACENFMMLCASGYYDHCPFHRVLQNYLIQTGDPTFTGDGGSSITGEKIPVEPFGDFSTPGYVAYAETEGVGSQFFITACSAPELAGKYTAFGHVIYGLNNVIAFSRMPTFEDHQPIRPAAIKSITIHANPLAQ